MKRLYRSRTNRVISGVCGGIAEYLGMDPVLVRILWIAISCTYGAGIIIYIIASIVIPENREDFSNPYNTSDGYSDFGRYQGQQGSDRAEGSNPFEMGNQASDSGFGKGTYGESYDFDAGSFESQRNEWKDFSKYDSGKSRVLFGFILVCVGALFLVREFFGWLNFKLLWPLVIIGLGVMLLLRGSRNTFTD